MSEEKFNIQYWTRYFDNCYNCYYYVNASTGHSQWDYPSYPCDIVQDVNVVEKEEIVLGDVDIMQDDRDCMENTLHQYLPNSNNRGSDIFRPELVSMVERKEERSCSRRFKANKINRSSSSRICEKSASPETSPRVKRNYVQMARLYKIYRPYSLTESTFKSLKCVLCHDQEPIDVFFPCEHRCVCRSCIQKEQICDDVTFETNVNGYCNCSLCAEVIKKIIPFENGKEIEKYWAWVLEQKIDLPDGFLRNFRHSAAVIKAVYVNNAPGASDEKGTNESTMCAIS